MDRGYVGVVLIMGLCVAISAAQAAPPSDQQALTLTAQSVAAMTGGSPINDITLSGTAVWTVGSDQQTGSVTLLAKGFAESRMDLGLSGGPRSEIRNSLGGNWAGSDGVFYDLASHNCWTDASWFFPGLSSLAAVSANPNIVLSYLGTDATTGLQQIHAYTYQANYRDAVELSGTEFYLDSQTSLSTVVTFNEHPDNDQSLNIAVQVMYSDYRDVNGVKVPFHIQRYVNTNLTLDIQITSATLNTGIPDSNFSAP